MGTVRYCVQLQDIWQLPNPSVYALSFHCPHCRLAWKHMDSFHSEYSKSRVRRKRRGRRRMNKRRREGRRGKVEIPFTYLSFLSHKQRAILSPSLFLICLLQLCRQDIESITKPLQIIFLCISPFPLFKSISLCLSLSLPLSLPLLLPLYIFLKQEVELKPLQM